MGERYKMVTKETKDILLGKYGATVKPFNQDVQKTLASRTLVYAEGTEAYQLDFVTCDEGFLQRVSSCVESSLSLCLLAKP